MISQSNHAAARFGSVQALQDPKYRLENLKQSVEGRFGAFSNWVASSDGQEIAARQTTPRIRSRSENCRAKIAHGRDAPWHLPIEFASIFNL